MGKKARRRRSQDGQPVEVVPASRAVALYGFKGGVGRSTKSHILANLVVNSNGLTVDLESEGHRSILPRITVPISTLVAPRARNLRELQASEKSNGRAEEPLDPVAFDPDQVLDRMSAAGVADLAVSTEDIVETVRSVRRDDQ